MAWRAVYLYLAVQSLCIVILLELLLVGFPYGSLFLVIFIPVLYMNLKLFRHPLVSAKTRQREGTPYVPSLSGNAA
jgi:hypothetical protein